MNTDIRISTSFLNHRKRKKLTQILGDKATGCLIDLWINTAINKPKGVLNDMDKTDISLDAGWHGDADLFVDTLVTVGFLDLHSNVYSLHDWDDHQSWVVGSEERSLSAAKNQVFRWCIKKIKKKDYEKFKSWYYEIYLFVKGDNTESILSEYNSYINGNTPIPSSPIPSSPKEVIPEGESSIHFQAIAFLKDIGVEKQIAQDWLKVRKAKRLAHTETAFKSIQREIEKTDKTPNEIITICVERSWAGFKASWDLGDGEQGREGQNCSQECFSHKSCKTLGKLKEGPCGAFNGP